MSAHDPVTIGLVAASDRASQGVYRDEGIPALEAWLAGDPLDVQQLLYTKDGKPRISIISIAHLNDAERMFVVTLVANEVVAWMRAQPGTQTQPVQRPPVSGVDLTAGKNLFTFPQKLTEPGFYSYDVQVDVPGDVVPQNGQTSACLPGFHSAAAPHAGQENLC